ncbi:DNA replication complex GINS protein PSF2 [Venturia nashicola]|uniref:DNA replication complex GINS protein PSF2 n=1 Tax=Venturia nashicola TaxID=86259 RepID=A0A4Z1NNL1_9PEZI|nr:DNA replication complex GINS protein PSF2 [Venturia nashicola]TLD22671.1 DNA replication complex GINS protein PSF2 [Venturia nashicola]
MALPLPPGLTPPEVAFLCEMEMVTVIPRQRLESLNLLSGQTQTLVPPHRTNIPLWLALLLKKQRRANIAPPPWLRINSLQGILDHEIDPENQAFSPPPKPPPGASTTTAPFLDSSTSTAPPNALPYHWQELGEILLQAAPDDFEHVDQVRRLMRDLREVRMAKIRKGTEVLDAGGGIEFNGVGGLEICESRAFVGGVIDGLRRIASSKEQARREKDAEDRENGYGGTQDDDDEMLQ